MIEDDGITGPTALEDYETPSEGEDNVESAVHGAVRYAFIGSGQGGSRIAAAAYARGYRKTIVLNTAPQDLVHIQVPDAQKLLLDIGAGGAGKDILKGEEAATAHQGAIYDLMRRVFGRKVDHIMICAGAGGGSGGGSIIPLVTVIAKKYLQSLGYVEDVDQRVGVILSLPRSAEAQVQRVAFNALTVAERVSELAETGRVTPFLVIDNAKIQDLHPRLTPATLWQTVNDGVVHLFDLFNRLPLRATPYTSFDPADYETVVRAGGHMVLGVTKIPAAMLEQLGSGGDTAVSKVMRDSITKTLLADGFDLSTAKASAALIVASEKTLATIPDDVVEYVYSMLGSLTGGVVHRGMYTDDRDDLRVYTIIGGLQRPAKRYERMRVLAAERYPDR